MDHLHRLPPEILLQILRSCTHLSTLCSLVNTSRQLSSIFENNTPAKTVDAVLECRVPDPARQLMRVVIFIRTGGFKHHVWEDMSALPLYSWSIGDHLTGPLLRKFLHLAHNIHVLSHLCLDRCLESLGQRSAQSEKGFGPPSWTEEQRTVLSFWRVQYFYELKNARLKGRLIQGWEPSRLAILGRARIERGDFVSGGFELEQVMTVVEFIDEAKAETDMSDTGPSASRLVLLPSSGDRDDIRSPWHWKCPWIDKGSRRSYWGQLQRPPTAWRYLSLHGIISPSHDSPTYPLRHLPYEPFRKLGLFLWDQRRMAQLGLWPDPDRDVLDYDEGPILFPAWLALLSLDEVSQAAKYDEDDW